MAFGFQTLEGAMPLSCAQPKSLINRLCFGLGLGLLIFSTAVHAANGCSTGLGTSNNAKLAEADRLQLTVSHSSQSIDGDDIEHNTNRERERERAAETSESSLQQWRSSKTAHCPRSRSESPEGQTSFRLRFLPFMRKFEQATRLSFLT